MVNVSLEYRRPAQAVLDWAQVTEMVMFTARVPYYGLVDWEPQRVARYARELADLHQSRRRWLLGSQHCAACGSPWPCFAAQWALGVREAA